MPPADPAPERSPPQRRMALWAGGAVAIIVAVVAIALMGPWGSIIGKPGVEAHEAAAAPGAVPSGPAAPQYHTLFFQVADLAQLKANLEGMGIPAPDAAIAADELVAALGTIELMTVSAEVDKSKGTPAIHALTAELGNGAGVRLVRAGAGKFSRETVVETSVTRIREASGTYNHNTFYDSAMEVKIPGSLVSDFTQAFAFDVDWAQVKVGDRFRAVWEETVSAAGRPIAPPRLLAVEFETGGVKRSFFAYIPSNETVPRWFDANGNGNARSLMRTPIDGARITSKFGPRFHPIYKTQKNHNGVDFAAPIDTPVFAAGKGTVISVGFNGRCPKCGYGNLVKIDHGDGLVTHYAHLNGFAEGLKVGDTVMQGQVIGYLGNTGGSTGPHLHFEINVNAQYVDPLSFENTVSEALSGDELQIYLDQRKRTLADIDRARQAARPAAPPSKPKAPR